MVNYACPVLAVNPQVTGSNPVRGAKIQKKRQSFGVGVFVF